MSAVVSDHITKVLCKNKGCLEYGHLRQIIPETFAEDEVLRVLSDSTRFVIVEGKQDKIEFGTQSQDSTIVAKTSLRVCQNLLGKCNSCDDLHLCRYFVCGNCRYRNKCKNCHDLDSIYNTAALKRTSLQNLEEEELFQLLLQNDSYLLPEICSHYNRGNGEHGSCMFKTTCNSLHICKHFIQDNCKFGSDCKRAHKFTSQAKRILKGRGLSQDNMRNLHVTYKNKFMISSDVETPGKSSVGGNGPHHPPGKTNRNEICLFFIRDDCSFKEQCFSVHFHLPYRWQELDSDGISWKDLPNNEDIEKAYCNPDNHISKGPIAVNFLTMTCGYTKVRRLSTASSVTKPPHFILTTEWLWYWRNDQGTWSKYDIKADGKATTSITSQSLENAYQDDPERDIQFSTGGHQYILSFKGMYELNRTCNAERQVRRRPRYVSAREVEEQLQSEIQDASKSSNGCGSMHQTQ